MKYVKNVVKSMVPEWLRMGQLVLRRAHDWTEAGVIFVHVPKNGGTSINTALYGRFMGHYRVRDIEFFRPDLMGKLPSFAVTRNPWARTYSAWNFARKGTAMKDGAQIRNPARYQTSEFESFERFVLEWLPRRDLSREDYVFRPQSQFLIDRCGALGVEHLGRIEDATSYLSWLEHKLGRKVEIGHLNSAAVPFAYRKAYSTEMKDVVARCYSADLGKITYDF